MSDLQTRIVKLPANQAGPYSQGYNRITVSVPPNMVVDMSRSFLQCEVNINTADGDVGTGNGVYNVGLQYRTDKDKALFDVGLVKNCRLKSEKLGIVEETQDVNHLRTNLNHLQLSRAEQLSLSVNSVFQKEDRYFQKGSIFRVLNSEGTDRSLQQLGRIPIKLSQLYGMGQLQEVDTARTGELDITVELDVDNIAAQIIDQPVALACADVNNTTDFTLSDAYGFDFPVNVGDDILVKYNNGANRLGFFTINATNPAANTFTVSSATTGGARTNVSVEIVQARGAANMNDSDTVVLSQTYETLNGMPFYVGQKVQVSSDGGATANTTTLITGISRSNLGVVSITLAAASTGGAITNVVLAGVVPTGTTSSIVYENLELVLYEKNQPSQDARGGYRIYTYQTEKANGNGNPTFNHSFQLPPNTINAVLMNKHATSLYSDNDDAQNYRLVLDNVALTDRPVKIDSPLYYDELGKWNLNGGAILRNLRPVENCNAHIPRAQQQQQQMYVGTPTPETVQDKILQYEVNTTTNGLRNINVYKQLNKVIGG